MTKTAALQKFFSGFMIPAFPTDDVRYDTVFPWLTYEPITDGGDAETAPTVELWYYGWSNAEINAKCEEVAAACRNGAIVPYDGGGMVIWCGAWTSLRDDVDPLVKRRRSNFRINFLSTY